MPFLRYKIGDIGSWAVNQNCKCGRGWPLLSKIEGRSFDIVITPNGNRIGGTFWTILFRQYPGIKRFQVHQIKNNKIIIYYVLDPEFKELPKNSLKYWSKSIKDVCGENISFEYSPIDKIELTVSGKTRIVKSEIIESL